MNYSSEINPTDSMGFGNPWIPFRLPNPVTAQDARPIFQGSILGNGRILVTPGTGGMNGVRQPMARRCGTRWERGEPEVGQVVQWRRGGGGGGGGGVIVRFFPRCYTLTHRTHTVHTHTHTHVEGWKGLKNRKHPLEEASSFFHFLYSPGFSFFNYHDVSFYHFQSQRGQICK